MSLLSSQTKMLALFNRISSSDGIKSRNLPTHVNKELKVQRIKAQI